MTKKCCCTCEKADVCAYIERDKPSEIACNHYLLRHEERTDSPEKLIRDMLEAFNICHRENKLPYRAGTMLFEQRARELGIDVREDMENEVE